MNRDRRIVEVVGGKIRVSAPYEHRRLFKAIDSARWNPTAMRWEYPATPDVARDIVAALAKAGLPAPYDDDRIVSLVEESAARDRLASGEDMSVDPVGVKVKFWQHQRRALGMTTALRYSMLAMGMGTGKTLVALATMTAVGARTTLVFAPRYVCSVWREQADQHLVDPPLVMCLDRGAVKDRLMAMMSGLIASAESGRAVMIVMNYDAVAATRGKESSGGARALQDYLLSRDWDLVIWDESQRIKNPGGATSRFMSLLRDRCARRLALSGTPAHRDWSDVYAQYRALSPDIFGTSFQRFKQRFFEMDEWGGVRRVTNPDELHKKFYHIAFRVNSDDVLDLPPANEVVLKCDLEPAARKIYDELDEHMITEVQNGTITAANGGVKLIRLLQVTGGWLRPEDAAPERVSTAKIDLVKNFLDDLPLREPIVFFVWFVAEIEALAAQCREAGRTVSTLYGKSKPGEYDDWREGKTDVLIIQPRSGSLGISCVRARIAVIYSLGLVSPGDWDQSFRRLVRPGQERPVTFYHLHARSTRDGSVYRALRAGADAVRYILDEMLKGKTNNETETETYVAGGVRKDI